MIEYAYAQAASGAARPTGNPITQFFPLILIFVVFYFLLIRPQQKKEKERRQMINTLKKGDNVVTTGGIYGTVVSIKPATVEVKIDENVKIQISKNAISTMITQDPNAVQQAK